MQSVKTNRARLPWSVLVLMVTFVVLNSRTGVELWRTPRDEPTSWATPLVVSFDGTNQVVVPGTNRIRSYDLESGAVLWRAEGLTVNCIPSPVRFEDTVLCMSGYRANPVYAIALGALGDIGKDSGFAWSYNRGTPYVPSPAVSGGQVYFTSANSAVLTSLDARNGSPVYDQERIAGLGTLYASPVVAAGRLYLQSRC
ncbi:MAG: PQQ-like beta-propeller repeat protein [Verrucomicrobia bacterium]|jgi:outer membrane protein assembly factor BamB|nr:PQQ-like beta-propeller repeat protein [Verrucomicrobiota bacterium]